MGRYGSLDLPARPSEEDRFWLKVDKRGPDECWPWTGGTFKDGYGAFKPTGHANNLGAHRYAYELLVGPIPEDLVIDHMCHDPKVCELGRDCPHRRCVNPAHMKVVTAVVNNQRQGRWSHCPNGHPRTEGNTVWWPSKPTCRLCLEARGEKYNPKWLTPPDRRA